MSQKDTLYNRLQQRKQQPQAEETPSLFSEQEFGSLANYRVGPRTVTQFENNADVIRDYDIVTEYLGNNRGVMSSLLDFASVGDDGPAEMMRDTTMRVSTIANHALKMDDAPEHVKTAYKNLRNKWDEVEVSGAKEWWKFAKDYGTDVIASYETMPAILAMIFSGGTAGAAGAATHVAARKSLHSALNKTANAVGGNSVKSTAAYAGTITGLHDLAYQDLAVDLGEQEQINLGQTAGMATFGTVLGGGVAYGLKKAFSKNATQKLKKDLEEDGGESTITVRVTDNKFVEEAAKQLIVPPSGVNVVKQLNLFNTDEVVQVPNNVIDNINEQLELFVDDIGGGEKTLEELQSVVIGQTKKTGATGKQIQNNLAFNIWKTATSLTGKFVGKSAGILTPYTKFSKTAQSLQERLSHEFATGLGKQKELVGMDLSEASAAITGQLNTEYLKIMEPLAINTIKGDVSDAVNKELNIAIRGGKTEDKTIQLAAIQLQDLFKRIGNELHQNGIIDKQVENYIPRMWNRKAIENNSEEFKELLVKSGEVKNLEEANEVVFGKTIRVEGAEPIRMGGMLDLNNQLDGGSGGQYFAAKRKFSFEDDSIFTDFLNTDLIDVTTQYNYQAGKALAKKKVLLSKNQQDFERRWINPIDREMRAAGKTLTDKDKGEILSLYQHATGEGLQRFGTGAQTISDGYTLATRLALLPLATVGSLTEIFINIGKAGFKNSAKGFAEASEASFAKITGNLHSDLMTRHGLTANEAWRELKKHGIAMEQAQAQIGQRLVGDDLATESMQNASNKFFRMNFLDQWTKFVQMTSFASGKNLIKENLEFLAAHGDAPATKKIETLIGELNELGVDATRGVQWINSGAKTSDNFYNDITSGAARYTNQVILQPSAMSGLKPLLHTNPRTTVLFQLLGYPAAFTNTVMKGAVKAAVKAPTRNAPKLFAAGFIMTETARWMNWLRSNGESEKYITPSEARMAAVKRWGGNGLLFDNLQRASNTAKYSGTVAGFGTAPFGPIANDLLGVAYGKFYETAGTKVPFYAAGNVILGQEKMREYRKLLKEKDKELKGFIPDFEYNVRKERFNKGGEVEVPNAPAEPDERINKLTGLPYNYEAGSAFMDDLDPEKVERQGFAFGSVARTGAVKLKGFIAEAIDEYSNGLTKPEIVNEAAQKIENSSGIDVTKYMDEYDYDPMSSDMPMGNVMNEVGDEEVEDYVMSLIKVTLNEKDIAKAKNYEEVTKILDEKGASDPEFLKAMDYSQEYIDEFDYVKSLQEIVDADGSMAMDILTALTTVKNNKQYLDFDSISQSNLDKVEELGLNDIAEFLSHRFGVDDSVTDAGKVNVIKNAMAKKLEDPKEYERLTKLRDNFPSVTRINEINDLLPEPEVAERLAVFLDKSKEKKPMFRGVSSYQEKDFEVAFASPREMGVHVGARGQADYRLMDTIDTAKAIDFSVPNRRLDDGDSLNYERVPASEIEDFYAREGARINNFKEVDWDNITLDELDNLLIMKDEISVEETMPSISMMQGYIQVKNPLVIESDMPDWTAETLLTVGAERLVEAVKKGLGGKAIPEKHLKTLESLMNDAFESNTTSLVSTTNLTPDIDTLFNTTLDNVELTKGLQKWLDDLGFDSIKYRNDVEPLLDVDAGYEPYSYILFEPTQYKSIYARKFDPTDRRMAKFEGGKIDSKFWAESYNAEDRPLEERIADYEQAQDIEPAQNVLDSVDYTINSGAFDYEMEQLGISAEELREGMINIAKIESSGGHLPKKAQVSPTGARGLFQVILPTAREVLKPNNYFGKKAAEASGVNLSTLRNMSDQELRDFLLNDDRGNALFSAAIIMQKLKHKENITDDREKFMAGSVARVLAPKMTEGFYSPLEKAALNLTRKKGTGSGFLNDLKKGSKVTEDELEFTGVTDQLKDVKEITKEEVQEIVSNSKINLGTIRGDDLGEKQFETAYDEYTLAVADRNAEPINYEEILITLPSNTGNQKIDNAGYSAYYHWGHAGEESGENIDKTIAHLRVAEARGGKNLDKPTLLIEEIQSDYHQAGSKQGYNKDTKGMLEERNLYFEFKDKIKFDHEAQIAYDPNDAFGAGLRSQNLTTHLEILKEIIAAKASREDIEKFNSLHIQKLNELETISQKINKAMFDDPELETDLIVEADEIRRKYGKLIDEISDEVKRGENNYYRKLDQEAADEGMDGVPPEMRPDTTEVADAPFKKSWHKLALNKALIDAVEKNHQAIALTTGKQQAERYVNPHTGESPKGLAKKYDGTYLKYLKAFAKKYNKEVELKPILAGYPDDDATRNPIHMTYFLELTPEMKKDILQGMPQFAEGGLVDADE